MPSIPSCSISLAGFFCATILTAGLVLLGSRPASPWCWSDRPGAGVALGIVLMAWNSLIQIVTTPFFIWLILGQRVSVDIGLVAQSVLLYLGLPLLTGALSRRWMLRNKGQAWFEKKALPVLENVQLIALLLTLVVMFALKGDVILQQPELIWRWHAAGALFLCALFRRPHGQPQGGFATPTRRPSFTARAGILSWPSPLRSLPSRPVRWLPFLRSSAR